MVNWMEHLIELEMYAKAIYPYLLAMLHGQIITITMDKWMN